LLPYSDRVALSYPEISLGPVSRFLGILASTTARWSDANRYFEDALALSERMGARPWLARTQEEYGRMLLARGEPGDAAKAHGLLDSALALRSELGMSAHASTGSETFTRS